MNLYIAVLVLSVLLIALHTVETIVKHRRGMSITISIIAMLIWLVNAALCIYYGGLL